MAKDKGDGHYAHHRAARTEEESGYWLSIVKEINETNYEKYILSSEILYGLPEDKIRKIKEYIGRSSINKTSIIMIKREPIGFLKSEYKQQIKITNESRGIVEFARENMEKCKHIESFERWKSILRCDKSVFLKLEKFDGSRCGLIHRICQVLGIPDCGLEEKRMNTSLSDERAEVLRLFNKISTRMNVYGATKYVGQLKNSIKRGRLVGRVAEKMLKLFTTGRVYEDHEIDQLEELLKHEGLIAG